MKNIVLTGFMGTGKTEVGRVLAKRLGACFVDTDGEIERASGMSIPEIFSRFGEGRFRDEETAVIKKLSRREGLVIATGGGAVLRRENVAALKEKGVLVLIRSSPEVIARRVASGRRPLLAGEADPLQKIKRMLADREEAYSGSADLEVYSGHEAVEEVAQKIIELLRERKYLQDGQDVY